jgi:CheY-like chemotaxis protein
MHGTKLSKSEARRTVLIVDDDSDDIKLTQRTIASVCPQLNTIGLNSADALIAYLQGEKDYADRDRFPCPFLLLLDLRMPGKNGFDVLAWLRSHPPHDRLPAVVLTATGAVMVARQAYALGARSFLNKPISGAEFLEMMRSLGGAGHASGGAARPQSKPCQSLDS